MKYWSLRSDNFAIASELLDKAEWEMGNYRTVKGCEPAKSECSLSKAYGHLMAGSKLIEVTLPRTFLARRKWKRLRAEMTRVYREYLAELNEKTDTERGYISKSQRIPCIEEPNQGIDASQGPAIFD